MLCALTLTVPDKSSLSMTRKHLLIKYALFVMFDKSRTSLTFYVSRGKIANIRNPIVANLAECLLKTKIEPHEVI